MHDDPAAAGLVETFDRSFGERGGGEERIALDIPGIPVGRFVLEHIVTAQSGAGRHQFAAVALIDERRNGAVGLDAHVQAAVVEHERIAVMADGDPGPGRGIVFGQRRRRTHRPRILGTPGIRDDHGVGDDRGIVVHGCDGASRVEDDPVQSGDVPLVFRPRLTVHPCDGGTGQNVVELVEQQGLPDTVQFLTRIDVTWVLDTGHGAQVFGDTQHRLLLAAAALHVLLGGEGGTVQFKVQFALEHRGLSSRIVDDILTHAVEQLVGSTEFDLRRAGEIMVAADARGHLTGGAATAIAEAVQQNRVTGEVLVQEVALRIHQLMHAHPRAVGIRRREVRENTRAIDAFPHERVVWELGGVVPRDLLREEPVESCTAGDLRPGAGVAETVR